MLLALESDQPFKVYERLESELSSYPLIENAVIQGFAGVLCLLESLKFSKLKDFFQTKAKLHLEKSLQISPLQIFEYYYLDLLSLISSASQLHFLKDAYKHRPDDLVIARNLFQRYSYNAEENNNDELLEVADQILLLNPVEEYTNSLSTLVTYYETRNVRMAIGYLMDRLDYNSGDIWLWEKLILLVKDLDFDFEDRSDWWPQMHFNPISSTLDWNQEHTLIVLAIACIYISPHAYSQSLLCLQLQAFKPFSLPARDLLQFHFNNDFDSYL